MGEGLLKHIVQRPRPYADFPWVHLLVDKSTIYSFPSGHTTSSVAAAYVLSKYFKKYAPFYLDSCSNDSSLKIIFIHALSKRYCCRSSFRLDLWQGRIVLYSIKSMLSLL